MIRGRIFSEMIRIRARKSELQPESRSYGPKVRVYSRADPQNPNRIARKRHPNRVLVLLQKTPFKPSWIHPDCKCNFAKLIPLGSPICNCNHQELLHFSRINSARIQKCNCNCNLQENYFPKTNWRVPNPPGANALVAGRAPLVQWRSSQSCVTGGQQPIGNPYRFIFFSTPGNPCATPIVSRGEGSFSYQGVSTRGVSRSLHNDNKFSRQ